MIPTLAALIALQQIDSAVDGARRRLAELPAAEQEIDRRVTQAASGVDVVKASLAENQTSRRALEKDARCGRFLAARREHKAVRREVGDAGRR